MRAIDGTYAMQLHGPNALRLYIRSITVRRHNKQRLMGWRLGAIQRYRYRQLPHGGCEVGRAQSDAARRYEAQGRSF